MKPEMSVLGIDIAKRVFHAVGMDERGKIVLRKRLSRHDLIPFLAKLPPVLMGERTALVNEVHGLLNEYGIVLPKGVSQFRHAVVGKLESEKDKLSALSQEMFWKLVEEFAALEAQLAYYQEKLDTLAATHPE